MTVMQEAFERPRDLPASPMKIMFVFILGAFFEFLNQTLLNIALPHIMQDFDISASTAQWLVTSYLLVNGVLVPISAFLMHTYSTRTLFLTAMGAYFLGSLVAGFSPTFHVLLAGRILQAVGAGLMMPLMMAVFLTIFPPEQRGKAMGVMGLALILAPALGPTLSGWIVEYAHWRMLFFLFLPFILVDIFLAALWLGPIIPITRPKWDPLGAFFAIVGFGSLLYGTSEAGTKGWGDAEVLATIVLGGIFVGFFVLRSLTQDTPLLEFRVFRYPVFTLGLLIGSLATFAMYSAMVLLPIYLQTIRGFTPLEAGLLLLPGSLVMGLLSPLAGALFDRFGPRPLAFFGFLITLITTYAFSHLTLETTYEELILLYTLRGIGLGFYMMPLMAVGMNYLPQSLQSHGTAMQNTIRMVAGSVGTSFLVTVMSQATKTHLGTSVDAFSGPARSEIFAQVVHGMANLGVPVPLAQNVLGLQVLGTVQKAAFVAGINDAFRISFWILFVPLFLTFFLPRRARPEVPPAELSP
ncbi:MAG: DHA2 family efflux MFS transporter permease subunit [Brockia lithotrophica]|nr:DHA2 family efflux MFS transporter permease subunit [Brockia lithotrophica]